MKFAQLEYFCAVSRYHSITQAAQKLYVTQPAISTAIRELEKEFSVSLFIRSKNHMTLTKEGEIFYQKATELLRMAQQTSLEMSDLGRQNTPIRIGIPPLLSTIFFPEMLTEFHEKYPDIPVELYEYGSIRAAQLVQEDMLDLALVNMHFYEIDKLNSYQILTDRIVFCVSPRHPLAGEKELTIEQIKDEPLILYNTDSVQSSTMAGIFESCGVKPNIVLRANQLYTIQKFIEQDLGGAFLYECLLKNMPGIVHIPITPRIEQEIGIIWPKGKYMNSRVEKFVAFSRQFTLMR